MTTPSIESLVSEIKSHLADADAAHAKSDNHYDKAAKHRKERDKRIAAANEEYKKAADAEYKKANKQLEKAAEHETEAGKRLDTLKELKPDNISWKDYVRAQCNLSQERADELIRIYKGTTTVEEVRAKGAERTRKHRAKKKSESVLQAAQSTCNTHSINQEPAAEAEGIVVEENTSTSPTTSDPSAETDDTLDEASARELGKYLIEVCDVPHARKLFDLVYSVSGAHFKKPMRRVLDALLDELERVFPESEREAA